MLSLVVVAKHILGAVDISAETEVVNFALVILIEILSNDEIEDLVGGGKQAQVLEHSLELWGGSVARLGAIEILEAGLEEHSGRHDDSSHLGQSFYHNLHFLLGEHLYYLSQ